MRELNAQPKVLMEPLVCQFVIRHVVKVYRTLKVVYAWHISPYAITPNMQCHLQ